MTPRRSTYRVLALAGVVAVAACAGGCRGRVGPEPGGATNRKAREARQQAEQMAVDGAKGAAEVLVVHHPDLDKRNRVVKGLSRGWAWVMSSGGGGDPAAAVRVNTPAPPPVPPLLPTPPADAAAPPPPADPAPDPKPSGNVLVRERVVGKLARPTEAAADAAALDAAAGRIEERLQDLDPPVHYRPSAAEVRNEYVRRGSRTVKDPDGFERGELDKTWPGKGKDYKYVEYTVEVSADQVRELRTRARVGSALRVLGVVAGVALAGFLFLRLDEWTKGYLTSWLAFAAVALAGGVAAALVLV
ncbi:MAG: hypothetical protein K2X87_31410 [Gemmataceae bacterium]|nr:hypothetical protein [Gemmataceae bacterium]